MPACVSPTSTRSATASAWASESAASRTPTNPGYDPNCTWGQHRFGTEGFQFAGKSRTDYTASGDQQDFLNGIKQFGARDTLDDMLEAQPGARGGGMNEQHGKNDDTFVDFRVGAEKDFGEDSMAYLTLSTGHKSGGFNDTIQAFGAPTYSDFEPEAVYAAEIGTKNEFVEQGVHGQRRSILVRVQGLPGTDRRIDPAASRRDASQWHGPRDAEDVRALERR